MNSFEWAKDKIKLLFSDIDLFTSNNLVAYETSYWTAFKLLFLQYFTPVYTTNLKNWANRLIYFDPLAASGINLLGGKDFILGSPLIVLKRAKPLDSFSKIVLNDIDVKNIEALEKRLKKLLQKYPEHYNKLRNSGAIQLTNKDCNVAILDFVNNFKSGDHALVFLDPFSFQISWKSLELLFSIRCDIIFLFVSQSIQRALGSAHKARLQKKVKASNEFSGAEKTLTNFIGNTSWENATNIEELLNLFVKQIRMHGKLVKNYGIASQTPEKAPFHYHLLFIFKKTRGGNPWAKSVDAIGIKIEDLARWHHKEIFDQLKKRKTSLLNFIEINVEKTSLKEAQAIAKRIVTHFKNHCTKIEIAGSIRRNKAQIGDIELVVVPKFKVTQKDLFGKPIKFESNLNLKINELFEKNFFTSYAKNGERYKQIWIKDKIKLDLFIVLPPAQFGVIYLIRTGSANYSKQFMIKLNTLKKFKIENGGLYQRRNEEWVLIETPTEIDVYNALNWKWIPAHDRK